MDAICLIGARRTGSNHLCEILRNVPDLSVQRELFAADGCHGIDPAGWPLLRELTGIAFADHQDPRLIGFAHERPGALLDALEQAAMAAGKRLLSFKLFPRDLAPDVIESDILTRPGMRVIVLMRRQIDSYISWRKAVEGGVWQGADTSDLRVALEADAFEAWLGEQERWYDHWRNYLNRRFLPCPVLRYELDIDQPAERVLKRVAGAAAQVGIILRLPATLTNRGLERQDKATSVSAKVSNWPAFSRELMSRGLERRAFGYPL